MDGDNLELAPPFVTRECSSCALGTATESSLSWSLLVEGPVLSEWEKSEPFHRRERMSLLLLDETQEKLMLVFGPKM